MPDEEKEVQEGQVEPPELTTESQTEVLRAQGEVPVFSAQDMPLSKEEFTEAFNKLVVRAREAGIGPLQVLILSYKKRALAMLDGILTALEDDDKSEKRGRQKPND